MNRTLFILLTAFCFAGSAFAAETAVGAYSKASVSGQEIAEAAQFAVAAESRAIHSQKNQHKTALKLLSVVSAEEQIVAGKNYRLTLRVEENGHRKTAEAVVWWQPWRKQEPYRLTSWIWK